MWKWTFLLHVPVRSIIDHHIAFLKTYLWVRQFLWNYQNDRWSRMGTPLEGINFHAHFLEIYAAQFFSPPAPNFFPYWLRMFHLHRAENFPALVWKFFTTKFFPAQVCFFFPLRRAILLPAPVLKNVSLAEPVVSSCFSQVSYLRVGKFFPMPGWIFITRTAPIFSSRAAAIFSSRAAQYFSPPALPIFFHIG